MLAVLGQTWALLLGMFLLMVGNGMQGSVLGLRGGIEEFGSLTMGFVMSGYFLGFLGGARATPWLLRRVGHVRVFAALASLMSAAMILFAAIVHPAAWILMRIAVGFAMSGCYIVAESWLNDGADNRTRGQTLSAYLIVQMLGIVLAQALLNFADPAGYDLFVMMAVVVSVAVVPILLSANPVPLFATTRPLSFLELYRISPLGVVGCLLLGGVFACLFGMSAVYATDIGLSTSELSIFIGSIYLGGMLLQFPIGWLSDRIDRRILITGATAVGSAAAVVAAIGGSNLTVLVAAAFLIGGTANPLYALLIAYTNDYLEHEDMPAAAAGLIAMNGIGAIGTPILVGFVMERFGPHSFMGFVAVLMGVIAAYAIYRMSVRPSTPVEEQLPVAPMGMAASPVAGVAAQDAVIEQAEEDAAREDEPDHAAQSAYGPHAP